jgi:hypothetical protein
MPRGGPGRGGGRKPSPDNRKSILFRVAIYSTDDKLLIDNLTPDERRQRLLNSAPLK